MVKVTVPLFYPCPAKSGGELIRKQAVLKAHVSRAKGVMLVEALTEGEFGGFRLGVPYFERIPSHRLTRGGKMVLEGESYKLKWAL